MTSVERTPKTINGINNNNNLCSKHSSHHGKSSSTSTTAGNWNTKVTTNGSLNPHARCHRHHKPHHRCRKSDSVTSTDSSDIRFTRRKLGDSQKCGCAVIAGFLVALLVASIFVYVGYTYLRPDPLPERVFRAKFRVINGDKWSTDLADQNSLRFQNKARDYRERINLVIRRSDLRDAYEGSEVLALDGTPEDSNELLVHFNLIFDPYRGLVSTADLLAIFSEEIRSPKYFANLTIDPSSLYMKEVTGLIEEPVSSSSPLGISDEDLTPQPTTTPRPPRRCEPMYLNYCKSNGYNITTYPNLLGHYSFEEVQADVIAFRELIDAECFREAFDFVCRLLQPPCERHDPFEPTPGLICRQYCQAFVKGCGSRIPDRFKRYFDCETFPESIGAQSCHSKPKCAEDLQNNAQSPRLCDGIADCPDLSDEKTCSFCPKDSFYCGRGRACVPKTSRCDGKVDCPDGADEKDCLAIAPLVSDLTNPAPLTPYLPRFFSEGFATFNEKGVIGKLCAEGMERSASVRQTVAESLCKSLGYETIVKVEIRNDTEPIFDYVRVLDPHAAEISFVRTSCPAKKVLYVGCNDLQCGIQSVLAPKFGVILPKMASPGDWPWLAALFREDTHVCDGTLISSEWVLTTESCFQGQPKATWVAVFGAVRLTSNAPWTQRRRIIGMVKSPVEGSTAALIRLETPVVFSDFIRPICLPDEITRKSKPTESLAADQYQITSSGRVPKAERLKRQNSTISPNTSQINNHLQYDASSSYKTHQKISPKEIRKFFISPLNTENDQVETVKEEKYEKYQSDEEVMDNRNKGEDLDSVELIPKAEPLKVQQFENYPLPERTPQVQYYAQIPSNVSPQPLPLSYVTPKVLDQGWVNCNTLGWSRQRDHLQRVQLKISDMAPCENISIATVNSMCTEATFQKNDCSEEEFAGSPVQCLLPGTNQWALVGLSSWRIACAQTGVERPRMYDKITSNAAWIRDTINAV